MPSFRLSENMRISIFSFKPVKNDGNFWVLMMRNYWRFLYRIYELMKLNIF